MSTKGDPDSAPEPFRRAVESLRSVRLRPEVTLEEGAAPQRLAPYALALTADVQAAPLASTDGLGDDGDEELATGRFVLLYDPAGHETWHGFFRVVTFVRAPLEADLASDALLPSVGWSWLVEALEARGVGYVAPSGTVTRVVSEPFGTMADRAGTAEIEIRASWTANDSRLAPHLEAWAEVLCTVSGLPPAAPGVVQMARPGGRRTR
jgi:Protein of unknown function (DUF3000)